MALEFAVVGVLRIYRELFAYAFDFGCGGVAGAVWEAVELNGEVRGVGGVVHVGGDFDAANLFLFFVEEQEIAGLDVVDDDDFHFAGAASLGVTETFPLA